MPEMLIKAFVSLTNPEVGSVCNLRRVILFIRYRCQTLGYRRIAVMTQSVGWLFHGNKTFHKENCVGIL
jgi:hypothetical protein